MTSKTTYTQGPWEQRDTSGCNDTEIWAGKTLIAKVQDGDYDGPLITAAPDMLVALKAVVAVSDRKTDEFDLARAAIAKATAS